MQPMGQPSLTRFISGILSSGAGNLITIISGFFCMLVYTRWLPKEEYGFFVLFQILLGLAISASGLGIDYAIAKFISSSEQTQHTFDLINTIVNYRFITLLAASAIIYIVLYILENTYGHTMLISFLFLLPPILIIEALCLNLQVIVSSTLNFNLAALMDAIYSIISLVLTVIAIVFLGYGTIYLIYIRLISRSCSLFFALYQYRFPYKVNIKTDSLKQMLKFGFPLYINNFFNYVYSKADSMIIGGFLGPSQIAIYEVAQKIPESLNMLYESFMRVYFPTVSKFYAQGNREQVSHYLNHTNRLLTFLGLLVTLGVVILQKEIIVLLFSYRYIESAPILAMLMFGLVLIILDNNLGNTLVAIGDSSKPPIINFFRSILTLVSYTIFIPLTGALGATIAKALGTAAANPINAYFLLKKHIQVNWQIYTKPILIFFVCVYINSIMHLPIWVNFIIVPLSFIACCLIFSIIRLQDFTLLLSEIHKYISKPKIKGADNEIALDN